MRPTYCYVKGNPRKIVEGKLGRKLTKDEEVHHINGCRKDDRPENLVELPRKTHKALHGGKTPQRLKHCPVCGGKKYHTDFIHVRIRRRLAERLKQIAFINHRRGIQMEVQLAAIEYCQRHEALNNRRDNGK